MPNALLVTVVHVKMNLGDNALNNERVSLVITKLPIKKVTNCQKLATWDFVSNERDQGAKKVSFTASHSGKLLRACISPLVISPSTKTGFSIGRIDYNPSEN